MMIDNDKKSVVETETKLPDKRNFKGPPYDICAKVVCIKMSIFRCSELLCCCY